MKIENVLKEGSSFLQKNNINNFSLDSEILLCEILKVDRKFLIMNNDLHIINSKYLNYIELLNKRSQNKPIAYLIKKKQFWNNDFFIDKNVLIPRPDSEILMESFLRLKKKRKISKILEIGVGSGCLILSILKENKDLKGVGIDIDLNALKVCKINSKKLRLSHRINLFKSDIDKFNYGKYDVIISNPPYIPKKEIRNLMKDVVDYEPMVALDGGIDGTSVIRKVVKKSSKLMKIKGRLILEIAHNQVFKVEQILNKNGFFVEKIVKDYAGHNRCVIGLKI